MTNPEESPIKKKKNAYMKAITKHGLFIRVTVETEAN